jgi:hypothetical protein
VLAILAVLGLVGFTWFAYWPLEGKIERVEALVPADVEFLYRTNWAEIRSQGWVQRNVFEHPVYPGLDPQRVEVDPVTHRTFAQSLETIPETEAQINDSLPGILKFLEGVVFGTKEFRVEKDVFPAEIVAAGKWCGGGDPKEGPPNWRQILVLTRVSPLVKFAFEAVKHGFVRERSVPADELEMTVTPEGWLRIERLRFVEPRRAQTCEGGVVRDSLKTFWVARHLDVLAISNSEELIRGVDEARRGDDRAIDRPQYDVERPEGTLAASIDLPTLHSYLARAFDGPGAKTLATFVGKYLVINSLDRLEAVVTPSRDGTPPREGLAVRADVRYNEDRVRVDPNVIRTYSLAPASVSDGIARLVPAKDTALVLQVKTEPGVLLHTLFDSLSVADRGLIDGRVREISFQRKAAGKPGYATTSEFLDDLAAQLGSNTGVAISRLASVFDTVKYDAWFSNEDPVPTAVLAVVFSIRDGVKQEEVDEFLSDRVKALGFPPPQRAVSPNGLAYSTLTLSPKPPDYKYVEPAFAVVDNKLILSSREDFLLEMLKTMKGETKSVADSPEFQAAMAPLAREATVAVFANGKNLLDLAWDYRNDHVHDVGERDLSARLVGLRVEIQKQLREQKGALDDKDLATINDRVDAEADRFRKEEYGRYIAEYRTFLDGCRRLSGAAFVLEARSREQRLNVGASVQFTAATGND